MDKICILAYRLKIYFTKAGEDHTKYGLSILSYLFILLVSFPTKT
ncbi:hypothetical protein [Hugenholtzia roseola]|nr:hypothetical protein [Hugenholtzia roseola]